MFELSRLEKEALQMFEELEKETIKLNNEIIKMFKRFEASGKEQMNIAMIEYIAERANRIKEIKGQQVALRPLKIVMDAELGKAVTENRNYGLYEYSEKTERLG